MSRLRRFLARLDGFTLRALLMALALAGGVTAALVVGLGLFNVSARKGHLGLTEWVLHTTFRNSVALRAGAVPPENLASPEMIALGTGHFEQACSMCHGRPGEAQNATIRAMDPVPPHISALAADWAAPELHWIIHQGAKMTGMPAWPAQREDDVWPVVAFVQAAARMGSEEYDRLSAGDARGSCAMCHGEGGVSRNPLVPRLDILSPHYIAASLRAYRDGQRDSGIMAEAASGLGESAIARISTRFPAPEESAPSPIASKGAALATRGKGAVPSCAACHGPWPERLNAGFPALSGQHAAYLQSQLKLWRDGPRGGGELAQLMHHAARDLSDAEIADLADYYAALPPARLDGSER
ncbi:c-type cytochrome [Paracoccus ravus]|uniref:c-type cytochrome n=1 Tax=Paracoccus ravus TaxID=2447760 RepID=UPI001FD7001E|nr:c-type cytochrome [Paracoccus ravus]